jgi:hypothetical protein
VPRAVAGLLAFVVVVALPVAARSQTTTPDGYGVAATKDLSTGVEYLKLAKTNGPVVAHVAHVSPGAPVDLRVVNAFDRISTSPKDLETTSSMCARIHCIVGVNGDFHKIGVPAGAVIVDGRMLHSPEPDRPQLTVMKDGRLVAGTFAWSGSLSGISGTQLPLAAVNAEPAANGLAVFTPEHGPSTESSSRVELVVRASGVGTLNQPMYLELVSLRDGGGPIPPDGAVLSGDGSAGQRLRDMWARRQQATAPARLLISSPIDARMSLGVEPVVLRDGQRATPWRDPNVINPSQPHTLIGWNKEGNVYLVAVDGRQAASEGVTMAEAADLLLGLGATDAVSLDGGGGTTFVAGGSVWNRPSDNDPARPANSVERGATNAFVVMARPAKPTASPTNAIEPQNAVPEPTADGSDGSGFGSIPWSGGPTAIDGVGLIGVDGQPTADPLSVGPSAAGSATGRRGQAATPNGENAEPDGSVDQGQPPVAQARSDKRGGDPASAKDDDLQSTLSAATSPSTPDPPAKGKDVIPNAFGALVAAAAFGGAGSRVALTRRRPRPRCSAVPFAVHVVPTVVDEVEPDAAAPVELHLADPEPPVDEVSIDAFAVVVGGEGARQWQDRPADPVDAEEVVEGVRLVDLHLVLGLHELVIELPA